MAKIANVGLPNTFDYWRLRSNESFDRLSQIADKNSQVNANTVVANNVLRVLGNTVIGSSRAKNIVINSRPTINSSATINFNLVVSGNTQVGRLLANGSLGTSNYVLRSNGNTVFWAPLVQASGNVSNTYLNANFAKLSGANFTGPCDFGNNNVTGTKLKNYKEYVNSIGSVGSSQALDLSTSNVFDITLTNPTCTVTFTNPPASGLSYSFTVVVRQDGSGNRAVTWPASARWPNGTAPTLSTAANAIDVLTFFTVDGGTKYFAGLVLGNMT